MHSIAFARFWQVDLTRECFLGHLDRADLLSLRLVSRGFAMTLAPEVFKQLNVSFDATSFSRQARMSALERIGHLVKQFTFTMPRTEEMFLPPLLDPDTMDEITFRYNPQLQQSQQQAIAVGCTASKYGSWELNDMLVRQYPLLFHAATNISSFTRALSAMPHLRHLRISCPDVCQSNRRDIVDYALVSLRLAIEQINPAHLHTLSIDQLRPSSLYYLRPECSIGSTPASTRVWRRIKALNMVLNSPSQQFVGDMSTVNHLKILHTYLTTFTALQQFEFTWAGLKGPCPLSLDTEPCTAAPSSLDYRSQASDLPSTPPSLSTTPSSTTSSIASYFEPFAPRAVKTTVPLRPINFVRLKSMRLRNMVLDASQAASFIHNHRKVLGEFQFEHCQLRTGTWDDALAPLTKISGSDAWKKNQHRQPSVSTLRSEEVQSSFNAPSPCPPPRPALTLQTFLPLSDASADSWSKNEILEVPLILSPSEDVGSLQLAVRDKLWLPDSTRSAFREDEYDVMSNASFSSNRRRRGAMALRRFGRRIGLGSLREEHECDLAMEGVRKLLRAGNGGRHTW